MTDDNQSQAITALNEALAIGFETADFEALKALHTEDSVLLPPRNKPMRGRTAITGFWSGVRNRFAGMVFSTNEFKPLGEDLAREIGTFEMAAGEGGGTQSTGKYMIVWQNVDGAWTVESIIWSRNPEQPQQQRQAGQGAGQGAGRVQGAGARQGGQGGGPMGYRQGGGNQGGGNQGGGQGGGMQGSYRQAGYRGTGLGGGGNRGGIGGGGGIAGAGRRGNPQQGGRQGQGGGGQGGRAQNLYDDNPGLYSNRDD